jgi:PAS domain S-box-containing protein
MKENMIAPQGKRGRSIQSRLILLLLFILVPVLAMQAYMYYDSYQAQRASELQANLEFARTVAKSFESFVQDVLHQELAIGLAITSAQPMTPGDITRLLSASQDYHDVRDFTWMDAKGDAIYSSNPATVGRNYSDRAHFRDVVDGREWMVSELLISRATGKPVFGISRGIRDGKGALLGVVVAMIIPEKLDARFAVERSKGGGFALVDNKGMLVYRYPAIDAAWEERNWFKQYPEFEGVLKGKEIATTVYAPYEGKNRLVGLTPVSSIGWAAGAGKSEEDVTGPIFIDLTKSSLLFLSVLLAAFFIALAVSRKIAGPVQALRAQALALGRGEEPGQVRINHVAEFQDLAEAFNTMAEQVRFREEALRKSEEKFVKTFQSNPACVGLSRLRDGLVIEANDAVLNVLGYSRDEFIGHKIPELGVWHDPADRERLLQRLAAGGRSMNQEYRLRAKTGELLLCNHSAELIQIGDEPHVIFTFSDMTERKRAEAELQKLAALVRHSNEFINMATLDGKMIFLNDAGAEMVGLSAEEVEHTHILQVVPGHLQDKVNNEVLPALKEKGSWQGELQYLNLKTGRLTDVYATTFTVKDPATGTTLFLANTSIDITERKRAEERVERFKALMDHNPSLTFLKDESGRYVYLNSAYEKQFDLPKDWYGKTDFDFWPKESAELFRANDSEILQSGQAKQYLEDSTDRDGTRHCWLAYKFFFTDSNNHRYVGGIGINVTDRVRAEEALRLANESLEDRVRERTMDLQNLTEQLQGHRDELRRLASELVLTEERERKRIAGILHDDIAQILAAVRLRLDMLQPIPPDPEHKQIMAETKALLLQSLQETRALMTDIGNPLLFDMGLKAACEALTGRLMERYPVRIDCDIPDPFKSPDVDVKAILYQVIRELLSNVVKHSRARNARVMIEADSVQYRVKITDDGTGFDPLMLGAPTLEGGFGLFSIRERLMAMGGSLRIDSAPGTGTVVTATLPSDRPPIPRFGGAV